jgi:glycosyltransferase involved in cell wall biosynthesis
MPAYNSSKFIERALTSIEEQTYNNYEVIVVDDGSVDNTVEVIENHSLPVKLIKQSNAGASAARNKGMQFATGKYIAFLDSDDEWLPNKLEVQYNLMENNSHWLASYTKERQNKVNASKKEYSKEDKNLKDIFNYPYLTTSTVMVKTDTIQHIQGFDETLNTAEDIDLYLKISKLGVIGEIQELLVVKHEVENSLGAQMSSYADNIMVIDRFFQTNQKTLPANFEALYIQMKVFILNAWAKDHLYRNEIKAALKVLLESLKTKFNYLAIKLIIKSLIKFIMIKIKLKQ